MTNTLPSKARPPKPSPRARDSAVGQFREKRNPINLGMGLLTPLLGQEFLDRHNLRDPLNRALKFGVKHGFSAAGTSTRQFKKIQGLGKPATRLAPSTADYFDLTPDDDQRMIVETVKQFAEEILRPAARAADDAASYPADLITRAAELGVTAIKVPEDFDGIADQRTAVTNALVAEALSYGDMGLALPILAPGGVASALTHWGTADQQATYLREFAGENVPQACLAIAEPHPLFDPTMLKTTAVRTPSGYRLDGVKSRGRRRRIVRHRSTTQRQADAVHRRIRHRRIERDGRSQHGPAGRRAGPDRTGQGVGSAGRAIGRERGHRQRLRP